VLRIVLPVVVIVCLIGLSSGLTAEDEPKTSLTPAERAEARVALEKFNSIIGGWRGVGQIRRGSNRGAWAETAEWVWQLKGPTPALKYDVEKGQHLKSATLTYDPAEDIYHLQALLPDKTEREFAGQLDDNKLELDSQPDAEGIVYRITITRLNEKRTLVLYEKRAEKQTRFSRIAEVGYTRMGTKLAKVGGGSPECIVTGGKGTSTIEYKGKTYYLCCSGCREAFLEDPEGIIAEAEERRREKAESEK